MSGFRFLAKVSDVSHGKAKSFEIEGVEIPVFNLNGDFYALGNRCTHTGGPLALGRVSEGAVVCPWHGAKFELASGKALCAPAREGVSVYRARVVGERLEIEI